MDYCSSQKKSAEATVAGRLQQARRVSRGVSTPGTESGQPRRGVVDIHPERPHEQQQYKSLGRTAAMEHEAVV
jgi:hypothetical protein